MFVVSRLTPLVFLSSVQKNTNLPPRQHPPASAAAVVPAAAATESNKSSSGRQRSSHPSTSTSTTPLPSLAYTYTPISDLRGTALIGKLVNIYGVSCTLYMCITLTRLLTRSLTHLGTTYTGDPHLPAAQKHEGEPQVLVLLHAH